MKQLETNTTGMTMYPISRKDPSTKSNIDGFVDDTSQVANNSLDQPDPHEAIANLQKAVQLWSDLLEASGGKLELMKCFYYALIWKVDEEGDPVPVTVEEKRDLNIAPITINEKQQG